MSTYFVKFTPLEPYFFGNEKTFLYPKDGESSSPKDADSLSLQNSYYIKSELLPSQTTLFGAIRYLLLPHKNSSWNYSPTDKGQNEETVGAESFEPNKLKTFGKIKSMSPLFLCKGTDILIPTPFDHIPGKPTYTPFSDYKTVATAKGGKVFTEEYDAKVGLTDSFMCVSTGNIVPKEKIFKTSLRVGVNRRAEESGFFKKQYCVIESGYSFGVYLNLEGSVTPQSDTVFLGQGKSSFAVTFEKKENNLNGLIESHLRSDIVYCLGDAFLAPSIYDQTSFAAVKTKTYRHYHTDGKKVKKGSDLYQLVTAGSVFKVPEDKFKDFLSEAKNDANQVVGFNTFVKGGTKMTTNFYKITCLTNLHVGSGDINFNIIDNEVEKDPVTGYPIIHASGLKGSLRDAYKGENETDIFGTIGSESECKSGQYKFLDAHLLARPMRLSGNSEKAWILVSSISAINDYLSLLNRFRKNPYGFDSIEDPFTDDSLKESTFVTNLQTNNNQNQVEGEQTKMLDDKIADNIKKILGSDFALVKDFGDFPLPVVARNKLDNGISKNLWYEEIVPYESIFYFATLCSDGSVDYTPPAEVVQIGGNASIGRGYCKIEKIEVKENDNEQEQSQ